MTEYRMPAEYEKHYGTLMLWPWRPGSWKNDAAKAKEIFTELIYNIAESEHIYIGVRAQDMPEAKSILTKDERYAKWYEHVHIFECDNDDAWARDTGATFVHDIYGYRKGISWNFNAWGGDYNGLYASWEKDQLVAGNICKMLDDECIDASHFVLEGGSIHVDGEGTLITTEECLLSPGRNPKMSREEIENELKEHLGVSKIIWIPEGIYNDETDGHVDNMCAFVGPAKVVLAWTDDKNDPQYERSLKAYNVLSNETDARGRSFEIIKLPIPAKPVLVTEEDVLGYDFEDGEDMREVGDRLAASYVNFYIANDRILLPQFNDENDALAKKILSECFPERKIVTVYARDILTGGGNIHCITQQIPTTNR